MDYQLPDKEKTVTSAPGQREVELSAGYRETVTSFGQNGLEKQYKNVYLNNLHIGYGTVNPETVIREGSNKVLIELHFLMKGKASSKLDCFKEPLQFEEGQANLIFLPYYEKAIHQFAETTEVREFELHFTQQLFDRFTAGFPFPEPFKNGLYKKSAASLFSKNIPISGKALRIINEIITCPFEGIVKKLILEAKAIELLALTLDQAVKKEYHVKAINRQDIEKLHNAREILDKRYPDPPTLTELATLTGLNEFKLKKGFKELFDQTVYGYVLSKRMEKAKKLLFEKEMNIWEVAESVGYKNATHFTAAFKRIFGILPKNIKSC